MEFEKLKNKYKMLIWDYNNLSTVDKKEILLDLDILKGKILELYKSDRNLDISFL